MEKGEGQRTVSEEEVCAVREGLYPGLLQQGQCEFPPGLTQIKCSSFYVNLPTYSLNNTDPLSSSASNIYCR